MRRLAAALASAALLTACSGSGPTGGGRAEQASAIPEAPPPSVVATADLPANDGPNILVVTTDDMRWDELRYTPNVRKYVTSRGLLFENSFAPNPLCCPLARVVPPRAVLPQPPGLQPRGAVRLRRLRRPPDRRDGAQPGGVPDGARRQVPQRVRPAALAGDRRAVGDLRAGRLDRLEGQHRAPLAEGVAVRRRHLRLQLVHPERERPRGVQPWAATPRRSSGTRCGRWWGSTGRATTPGSSGRRRSRRTSAGRRRPTTRRTTAAPRATCRASRLLRGRQWVRGQVRLRDQARAGRPGRREAQRGRHLRQAGVLPEGAGDGRRRAPRRA